MSRSLSLSPPCILTRFGSSGPAFSPTVCVQGQTEAHSVQGPVLSNLCSALVQNAGAARHDANISCDIEEGLDAQVAEFGQEAPAPVASVFFIHPRDP